MKRDTLIEYYKHISDYYNTDHNHKELLAWAGLVFFFGFCAVISQVEKLSCTPCIENNVISLLTVVVAFMIVYFMSNQFFLRDQAGDYSAAALKTILDLMDANLSEEDLQDYCIPNTVLNLSKSIAPHVLSKKLIENFKILENKGNKLRKKTKTLAYLLLVISTLLVIFQRLSMSLS